MLCHADYFGYRPVAHRMGEFYFGQSRTIWSLLTHPLSPSLLYERFHTVPYFWSLISRISSERFPSCISPRICLWLFFYLPTVPGCPGPSHETQPPKGWWRNSGTNSVFSVQDALHYIVLLYREEEEYTGLASPEGKPEWLAHPVYPCPFKQTRVKPGAALQTQSGLIH